MYMIWYDLNIIQLHQFKALDLCVSTPYNWWPWTFYNPTSHDDRHQYLFTSTEKLRRWPEAIPMTGATAQDWAETPLNSWITRFGVPDNITLDRGPAFTSQLWATLGQTDGNHGSPRHPYNPAANGMAEWTHRTLKAALMACCIGPDWKAQLPWALPCMRTTPKDGLNISLAEMVFGKTIAVSEKFFPLHPEADNAIAARNLANFRRIVWKYCPVVETRHDNHPARIPKTIQTCTHVFVRNDAHRPPLQAVPWPLCRPREGQQSISSRDEWPQRLGVLSTTWSPRTWKATCLPRWWQRVPDAPSARLSDLMHRDFNYRQGSYNRRVLVAYHTGEACADQYQAFSCKLFILYIVAESVSLAFSESGMISLLQGLVSCCLRLCMWVGYARSHTLIGRTTARLTHTLTAIKPTE